MTISIQKIDQAFQEAIRAQTFSGAQVLIGHGKETLFEKPYGSLSGAPGTAAVNSDTLFDVASLTKAVATTTLMMSAAEGRYVVLDDPVERYLPEFNRAEKLTLRQLLDHTSGLPDWLPLYLEVAGKGFSKDEIEEFYTVEINRTPLRHPPGEKRLYSDLGFILLGFILEAVYSEPLDSLFESRVAGPLGMRQSLFNPLSSLSRVDPQNIAATELCPWRNKTLIGEVHDDNAYVLGGVAGHAGLFSRASDLEKFIRFLFATWTGGEVLFTPETLRKFVGPRLEFKLGWDTVSPEGSQAGQYFSPKSSLGHLAFTGCSLWLDFNDQKYLILLTNRVHPTRDGEAIKEFRPRVHDLLVETFLEG
jgi:Beta-lactamase class C and other penicillin binding proteins